MIQISLRKTLLIAILCLLSGIGLSSLFISGNRNATLLPAGIFSAKALTQKADTIEHRQQEQIELLNRRNEALQHSLSKTSELLRKSKANLSAAQQNIRHLLIENVTNDSADELSSCDTLREYVKGYLDENALKDSLYDSKINLLESTVTLKDSALEISANTQQQMRLILNQTLLQYSWLETENFSLKEEARKTKRKQKLLNFGLALLSGAAAGYLVTH